MGIVLNRIPLRGADYYAGKSYVYSYYLYGNETEDKEKKLGLEKWKEILSSYTNKVSNFIKHLFEAVFKLSPK